MVLLKLIKSIGIAVAYALHYSFECVGWIATTISFVGKLIAPVVAIGSALAFGAYAIKSTYDINMEECKLLRKYYNAWFFTFFITRRLSQLDSKNTPSYLYERYQSSHSEEDFICKCSRLNNGYIFRFHS